MPGLPTTDPSGAAVAALPPPVATPRRARRTKRDWRGPLLAAPYFVHLAVFFGYPLVFAIVLVFHRWDLVTPMEWVGMGNIARLVADDLFARAMLNTGLFLVIHIPLQIVVALFFAELLNKKLPGRAFFRAIYFLPVVVSGVTCSF